MTERSNDDADDVGLDLESAEVLAALLVGHLLLKGCVDPMCWCRSDAFWATYEKLDLP